MTQDELRAELVAAIEAATESQRDWCPTCQGLTRRETADMVCMTCGRDYLDDEPVPGTGWKRLMYAWRERAGSIGDELAAITERVASIEAERDEWRGDKAEAELAAMTAARDDFEADFTDMRDGVGSFEGNGYYALRADLTTAQERMLALATDWDSRADKLVLGDPRVEVWRKAAGQVLDVARGGTS